MTTFIQKKSCVVTEQWPTSLKYLLPGLKKHFQFPDLDQSIKIHLMGIPCFLSLQSNPARLISQKFL